MPALATFGGALVFAVLGIVLALRRFHRDVDGRHRRRRLCVRRRSPSASLLLAYPAYLGYRAYRLPMINDITTDPIDPPRFDVLARLRPRGTVEYAGLYAAEQQRSGLSRHRAARPSARRPGRLRRGDRRHHQAQVARGGRPPAAAGPARRPDRGGGAHADHGLPRRRGDADPARGRRRADRRALGLALRPARSRHQRLAHPRPAGRDRRADDKRDRPRHSSRAQRSGRDGAS